MNKKELIKQISHDTELRPQIVKAVLDSFSDNFIREVVTNGEFHLNNCFTVKTKTRNARKTIDLKTGKPVVYPPTKVLSCSLSKKINYMFRWKNRYERNSNQSLPTNHTDK